MAAEKLRETRADYPQLAPHLKVSLLSRLKERVFTNVVIAYDLRLALLSLDVFRTQHRLPLLPLPETTGHAVDAEEIMCV